VASGISIAMGKLYLILAGKVRKVICYCFGAVGYWDNGKGYQHQNGIKDEKNEVTEKEKPPGFNLLASRRTVL